MAIAKARLRFSIFASAAGSSRRPCVSSIASVAPASPPPLALQGCHGSGRRRGIACCIAGPIRSRACRAAPLQVWRKGARCVAACRDRLRLLLRRLLPCQQLRRTGAQGPAFSGGGAVRSMAVAKSATRLPIANGWPAVRLKRLRGFFDAHFHDARTASWAFSARPEILNRRRDHRIRPLGELDGAGIGENIRARATGRSVTREQPGDQQRSRRPPAARQPHAPGTNRRLRPPPRRMPPGEEGGMRQP